MKFCCSNGLDIKGKLSKILEIYNFIGDQYMILHKIRASSFALISRSF